MKYIELNGHKIPSLGYGTYQLTGKDCERSVSMALDFGYRHIDTAQIYDNEADVGTGIKGIDRDELFLTTKIWIDKVSSDALPKSIGESLKRLKTDYVDLLLIHWPNPDVPFSEQMKALTDVQNRGLTKLIGVSNFTVGQLKHVREELGAPVVNNQVEYHPYLLQRSVLDYLRSQQMFLTAYSPVARGKVIDDPVIQRIAGNHGKSASQVALRWLIQQESVAAIPKAGQEKHMRSNFDIFDFELSDAEMAEIHGLAHDAGRMINTAFAPEWDAPA